MVTHGYLYTCAFVCVTLPLKSFVVMILNFTVHNTVVRRPDGDTVVCCAYVGED